MHIGGLHIFAGLFFILLSAIITFCYIGALYLLFVAIKCAIYQEKEYLPHIQKKFFITTTLLILLILSAIFTYHRITWMGDDNKHYKAKEYFIAGEVIYGQRKLLHLIFNPSTFPLQPYIFLQKKVYNTGIQYLPQDDGERFVWQDAWFIKPYNRKNKLPFGVGYYEQEPDMIPLLDICWDSLGGMMKYKISDPQMNQEYLLNFMFTLSYYVSNQGFYTGPNKGSGKRTRNHPIYRNRNLLMLKWVTDISEKWKNVHYFEELWKDYPYIPAIWQLSKIELLQDICISLPLAGEFSCEHPLMQRMHDEFKITMSANPSVNPIMNLKKQDYKQASMTYKLAVYYPTGQAGNYLLTHVCDKEIPTETYELVDKLGIYNSFYNKARTEHIFKYELSPLMKIGSE